MLREFELVRGKFGADEVARGEFVRAATFGGLVVGMVAPNLVVHLRKLVAMFGNMPKG